MRERDENTRWKYEKRTGGDFFRAPLSLFIASSRIFILYFTSFSGTYALSIRRSSILPAFFLILFAVQPSPQPPSWWWVRKYIKGAEIRLIRKYSFRNDKNMYGVEPFSVIRRSIGMCKGLKGW